MTTIKIQQVAEIEISYSPIIKPSDMVKLKCSGDAEKIFRSIWDSSMTYRESFYALYLNRTNKVLGYQLISIGGITGTIVDPRCIFQTALKANAVSIILAHNHPSGSKEPSNSDMNITRKIKDAGCLLDITLLDHLIMLEDAYVSFADEGNL